MTRASDAVFVLRLYRERRMASPDRRQEARSSSVKGRPSDNTPGAPRSM